MKAGWIDRVKGAIGIDVAVGALGFVRGRQGSFGPCPLCKADARGDGDRRAPIGIGREKGKWHCWRCNEGGDVLDLVAAVRMGRRCDGLDPGGWAEVRNACAVLGWCEGADADRPERRVDPGKKIGRVGAVARPRTQGQQPVQEASGGPWSPDLADQCVARLGTGAGEAVRDYLLNVRKFSEATIREWKLGAFAGRGGAPWVAIPLMDSRGDVVNVRFRSVPPPCLKRSGPPGTSDPLGRSGCDSRDCPECAAYQKASGRYRVCQGRPLPLFGSHNLSNDLASLVIVTEGELDVIALYEYGYHRGAVSGTAGAGALKDEWLDELEPYSGFVLAYDDDTKGNEGADALAERLGRYRCSRVTLPRKDAGQCLADGIDGDRIERALDASRGMLSTEIVRIGDYADEIERLINNPSDLIGRPTGSPKLDAGLGGLRPGLIVVTGETGHGKTSLTTWLLAQQALAGVPSILTSFEQAPIGTVQKLLRQEVGGDFTRATPEVRREAMQAMNGRDLFLVKHRGQMPFAELHDIVRYAVRRHGVRNILIDHLGFVVDPDADDERKEIQVVMRALSIMAEHEGVTILLICHPSNQHVQQRRRVGIADLKGASAIRQDAHEVWVVEKAKPTKTRPWPAVWVHLDKIRSDFGASGVSVLLAFDPLATSYADTWLETPSGKRGVRVVVPDPKPKATGRRPKKPAAETKPDNAAGDGSDDNDPDLDDGATDPDGE